MSVVWDDIVSANGAATAKSGGSLGISLLTYVFLMLQNVVIFTQNEFNCILNKIDRVNCC